ncbi:hypothetical protein LB505_001666 [Fusarium chuoi]|nr:hypothetical protein LB505_001666 [Fusarium chuoi]
MLSWSPRLNPLGLRTELRCRNWRQTSYMHASLQNTTTMLVPTSRALPTEVKGRVSEVRMNGVTTVSTASLTMTSLLFAKTYARDSSRHRKRSTDGLQTSRRRSRRTLMRVKSRRNDKESPSVVLESPAGEAVTMTDMMRIPKFSAMISLA